MKEVKNEFRRNTILFGSFCIIYGIASILAGMILVPGTPDQQVYVGTGIFIFLFAIWYLYDQLS